MSDPGREFRFFARMCDGRSPLYATLSRGIADDPAIGRLSESGQKGQSPANLLFGAVHFLLLSGAEHALAGFYPSVGGREPPGDAYPVFADFCRRFEDEIVEIVTTRRVQTNEVGRCGLLLPAFGLAARRFGGRPLYMVEVGASAGLNLLFDRYRYEYSDGRRCGGASPARVRTELRDGGACPVPDSMPAVAGRIGIDIAPVDVNDDAAVHWVEAMIWADMVERVDLFRAAVALARADPPRVIAGDGLDLLPDVLASAPPAALPCVFHGHATYQMSSSWRETFNGLLAGLAGDRDLAHASLEWLRDDPRPQLHLTVYERGQAQTAHLADCHTHGAWMRWLGEGGLEEGAIPLF